MNTRLAPPLQAAWLCARRHLRLHPGRTAAAADADAAADAEGQLLRVVLHRFTANDRHRHRCVCKAEAGVLVVLPAVWVQVWPGLRWVLLLRTCASCAPTGPARPQCLSHASHSADIR